MTSRDPLDVDIDLDGRLLAFEKGSQDVQEIFNSGFIGIDWSGYDFARSYLEKIGPTDTRGIDLGGATVKALFIKTSAPITLEFTQGGETRDFDVSPSVIPADYFTTDSSPSAKPTSFQAGIFVTTCGPITALSIKGIAEVKLTAGVLIGLAGNR